MVDSSKKFIKLNKNEQASKLDQLVKNRLPFYVWTKDHQAIQLEIEKIISAKTTQIFINNVPPSLLPLASNDLSSFFQIGSVRFFAKGHLSLKMDGNNFFEMVGHLYKYEKRSADRIITFPHRKIYLNIKNNNPSNDNINNIIPISKKKIGTNINNHNDIITKIINSNDNLFPANKQFRCLDISKAGISIMANRIETQFIEKHNTNLEYSLSFENSLFEIEKGKIAYIIDYVDPRAKSIKMFKIGIEVQMINEELNNHLDKILNEDIFETTQIEDDFNNFIT